MKFNICLYLLLVVNLSFYSCKSDEGDDPKPVNDTVYVDVLDTVYIDKVVKGWIARTGMSKVRSGHVAFSIGERGFITTGISGSIQAGGEYLADLWEYNAETDTWSQKANFPGTPRRGASAFVLNNMAYVGLGFQSNGSTSARYGDIWTYDMGTNVWTQKSNFNGGPRDAAVSFVVGGKAYIASGFGLSPLGDVWEYDETNDNWIEKSAFSGPDRQGATSFVLRDTAYIAGGGTCCGLSSEYFNDLWAYDQTNDTWIEKAPFPADGRSRLISFAVQDNGYIGLGSTSGSSSFYSDLWKFDNTTNSWGAAMEFPGVGRTQTAAFVIGGSAFVGCGLETSGGLGLNDFYEYIPE